MADENSKPVSGTITLEIGTKIEKPSRSEKAVDKTLYTAALDGTLYVITIEDSVAKEFVKGNKLEIPMAKMLRSQELVIVGQGQNYGMARYISLKKASQA